MAGKTRVDGVKTRQRVYDFIKEYIENEQIAPSYREIADAVGLNSTSAVSAQIDKLIIEGRIRRDPMLPRTIRLVSVVAKDKDEDQTIQRQLD